VRGQVGCRIDCASVERTIAADLATVHFSRDTGTIEDGWLPVCDCYRAGNLPGVPPVNVVRCFRNDLSRNSWFVISRSPTRHRDEQLNNSICNPALTGVEFSLMSTKFNNAVVSVFLAAWLLLCSPPMGQAALILDDPLQGATLGTRSGGAFVAGGWQVTTKDDTIFWHVPTITNGAAEFDVRGLNPNECRTGMEDKTELFHMYDYTFGNSDINYNGGYRDNPFKHFVRKIGCLDAAKVNAMEIVWQIQPNYVEPDTARLSWSSNTTYHFREEWGPDGEGNAVLKVYRDGVLLLTTSVAGAWNPAGHSVRIAASPRRAPDAGMRPRSMISL
jgi:hypothetical protein